MSGLSDAGLDAAALTLWVARLTLTGVLVTVLALSFGALLARYAAPARVSVWRAAVVALLCLPAASFLLPWSWSVPAGAAVHRIAESTIGLGTRSAEVVVDMPVRVAVEGVVEVPVEMELASGAWVALDAPRGPSPGGGRRLAVAFALAWGVVAAGLLGRLGAGLLGLSAAARGAADETERLAPLLPRDVRARVPRLRILCGGPFRVPVCWGLARTTVLLPTHAAAWPVERVRTVLLHEAAHAARGDAFFLVLVRVACALHWMSPLVWMLERRLALDVEVASDEAVVRSGVPVRAYAHALLDVASEARRARVPSGALALHAPGSLSRRVARLLEERALLPERRALSSGLGALLVGVAVASATATLSAGVDPEPLQGDDGPLRLASAANPMLEEAARGALPAWEPASAAPTTGDAVPPDAAARGGRSRVNGAPLVNAPAAENRPAAQNPPAAHSLPAARPAALGEMPTAGPVLPAIGRRGPVHSTTAPPGLSAGSALSVERVREFLGARPPQPPAVQAEAWKPGTAQQLSDETGLHVRRCSSVTWAFFCIENRYGEVVEARVFIDGVSLAWGLDVLVEHGVGAYGLVEVSEVDASGATIRAYTPEYLEARAAAASRSRSSTDPPSGAPTAAGLLDGHAIWRALPSALVAEGSVAREGGPR